jgi:hypothetical protein
MKDNINMDLRVTGYGLDSSCSGWDPGEKNEQTGKRQRMKKKGKDEDEEKEDGRDETGDAEDEEKKGK